MLKLRATSLKISCSIFKSLASYGMLITGFALALTTSSAAQTANQGSSFLRLEPNVIVDHSGFGQPVPAYTLFSPVGWKSSGGIEWGNQYSCTKGFGINWKVTSRDELTGVAILPHQGWGYNSLVASGEASPGCKIRQIYDVQSYLAIVLQNTRPDATNLQFRPRPDLVTEIPNNQWSRPWQLGMEYFLTEAGELSFEVIENGVTLDVKLMVAVQFTKTVTNTDVTYHEAVSVYAHPAVVIFAPQGQLDETLFTAMRKSAVPNPQWESAITEHIRIIDRTHIEGALARHQITMNAYRDIGDMIHQTWQNQQISIDKRAEDFIDVIWERQNFDDASSATGKTKLSSHYNHAWRLDDGTYVMTDNQSFNPLEELGISGQKLDRSK